MNNSNPDLQNEFTQSLERYKLTDWKWFQKYLDELGWDAYWAYDNYVWKTIEQLRPFSRYDLLKIPPDRQELFIKMACEYILENGGTDLCGIQFSSDYRYLIRTHLWTKK